MIIAKTIVNNMPQIYKKTFRMESICPFFQQLLRKEALLTYLRMVATNNVLLFFPKRRGSLEKKTYICKDKLDLLKRI